MIIFTILFSPQLLIYTDIHTCTPAKKDTEELIRTILRLYSNVSEMCTILKHAMPCESKHTCMMVDGISSLDWVSLNIFKCISLPY